MNIESKWQEGTRNELSFWSAWADTEGGQWPDDFRQRLDPELPLQDHVKKWLQPSANSVKLLDVGAGPLTILGKKWHDHEVEVIAVDALGEDYHSILADNDITPLIPTQTCKSEELTSRFDPNSFDLAYARNTLDHGLDPLAAIREMLAVVKPGCCVLLEHFVKEGEGGNYEGLHQWNFEIKGDDLMIWNPEVEFSVRQAVEPIGEFVELTAPVSNWCQAVIRKKP